MATAAMTFSPDLRVARVSLGVKVGRPASQPSGSWPAWAVRHSLASSGLAAAQASKRCCHSASALAPRSMAVLKCWPASAGTSKLLSGSKPSACLVSLTSSGPSGLPWASEVLALLGEPKPMVVWTRMMEGRPVSARAAEMALSMASMSWLPLSIFCTCQP